jgi:hypothetical protein
MAAWRTIESAMSKAEFDELGGDCARPGQSRRVARDSVIRLLLSAGAQLDESSIDDAGA